MNLKKFLLLFIALLPSSLFSTPETLTLDARHFLSVSEIRKSKNPYQLHYEVPEREITHTEDTDLIIHFDYDGEQPEGNYRILRGAIQTCPHNKKMGTASGRFYNNQSSFSVQPLTNALFATQNEIQDFTIQFFMNPIVVENNEILLYWSNTLKEESHLHYQTLICSIRNRRLVWNFEGFFKNSPNKIELSGKTKIKPNQWSFHRISFNSQFNHLEYSMDGEVQEIFYLTNDGKESALDCSPLIGDRPSSALRIGTRFNGRLDELAIFKKALDIHKPPLYTHQGKILFRCVDLGFSASHINRINLLAETPGKSAINAYYRISENRLDSILWNEQPLTENYNGEDGWIPFFPGEHPVKERGRYLQIALDLLPDRSAETSPQFQNLVIQYIPNTPPLPPLALTARPGHQEVLLNWVPAVDIRIRGYRISYGTKPGHYTHSFDIENPPFTENHHQQVKVPHLQNDILYYFALQPYDDSPQRQYGEFSQEVTARPGRIYAQ